MTSPVYLGLDPGASGGLGVITEFGATSNPWPETERDLAELIKQSVTGAVYPYAVIEAVHSMPGQGVASSFKFGRHYGLLRGFLIAYEVPFVEVAPAKWQRELGCLTRGDKNVSKARAQQLFPNLKITHATADAILLAVYCSRQDWCSVALDAVDPCPCEQWAKGKPARAVEVGGHD